MIHRKALEAQGPRKEEVAQPRWQGAGNYCCERRNVHGPALCSSATTSDSSGS